MSNALTASIVFESSSHGRAGPERFKVLEAIDSAGSITGAGKLIGLSYRRCWGAVQYLNELFGEPLVMATPGGHSDRGAALTEAGKCLLADYRRLQQELAEVVGRMKSLREPRVDRLTTTPIVSLRSTARNVWRIRIASIFRDESITEVNLDLGDDIALIATVPTDGFDNLQLEVGATVLAVVHPSSIILAPPDIGRTSARNHLAGTILRREDSPAHSGISIDLGGGKTIFTTILRESIQDLALDEGTSVSVLIKASQVILFVS
jgi:molybdate transport system regulatory protein